MFKKIMIVILVIIAFTLVKYNAYKKEFINKYDCETWCLSNVEAGIENEIESYIHYLINGKQF